MKKLKYITRNPNILGGKPIFRGTRVAVCTILNFLAAGDSVETVIKNYPFLTRRHIQEALGVAADLMDYEEKDIPA